METELIFIRHGETVWNEEKRYNGVSDLSLSEAGARKIRELKKDNIYPRVDMLFLSPMKRCMETAAIIYPDLQGIVIDEFKEIDFGRLEGKNFEELKSDPEYMKWVESGGSTPFPGAEDKDAYIDRVLRGYDRMIKIIKENGQVRKAAVVCHGGTIMSVMSRNDRDSYYSYMTPNGGVKICAESL